MMTAFPSFVGNSDEKSKMLYLFVYLFVFIYLLFICSIALIVCIFQCYYMYKLAYFANGLRAVTIYPMLFALFMSN